MRSRTLAAATGLAAGLLWTVVQVTAAHAQPAAPHAQPPAESHGSTASGWATLGPNLRHACAAPTPGHAACQAIGRTDIAGPLGVTPSAPTGMSPSDIRSAYALPDGGAGVTVAIVDAYDDPRAESDLATYRSQYGLPACTTANGCFSKVNQRGGSTPPGGDTGWGAEITLDLDAVSAACPSCHILLIESDDNNDANLYAADDEALTLGAKFVSNSWSSPESSGQTSDDAHFNHPGTVFAFATGDNGYSGGTQYPASSRYTVAIGGTSLRSAGNARGWTESAWSGAGSGCSAYEARPSWQAGVTTGCSRKANSDISADADPNTGLAIYDTYGQSGWAQYGGTSLATPLITSMWAMAGAPASGDTAASYPYQHTGSLNDVTSGTNGSCGTVLCVAGTGWDGPTGLGTPNGLAALKPGGGGTGNTVTLTNPGDQTGATGTAARLQLTASDSAPSATLTWSASGLPTGLSIAASTGLVTGTPSAGGTYAVTATATDNTGATGSTHFTWTVSGGGGSGTVRVTSPGAQLWFTGFAINPLQIQATDSAGLPLTFRASGLPAGLTISAAGRITGTPTRSGTYTVTVTATDSGGGTGSATFGWTIYQGV